MKSLCDMCFPSPLLFFTPTLLLPSVVLSKVIQSACNTMWSGLMLCSSFCLLSPDSYSSQRDEPQVAPAAAKPIPAPVYRWTLQLITILSYSALVMMMMGGGGGGSTAVQVKAIVMNVVMKRLNKIHYDILFLKTFECLC